MAVMTAAGLLGAQGWGAGAGGRGYRPWRERRWGAGGTGFKRRAEQATGNQGGRSKSRRGR